MKKIFLFILVIFSGCFSSSASIVTTSENKVTDEKLTIINKLERLMSDHSKSVPIKNNLYAKVSVMPTERLSKDEVAYIRS